MEDRAMAARFGAVQNYNVWVSNINTRPGKMTSLRFIGGTNHVFFIWLETGGGPRALQPSPIEVKVKLHSGWTRHHCLLACCVLSLTICLRPQAKHVEYGRLVFFCFFFSCFYFLLAAMAVHEKPCEAVKRLLLFPLSTNDGTFHGNQGAVMHKAADCARCLMHGGKWETRGSSLITSQVFFVFFFLLRAAWELYDFSDFWREEQRRSAVRIYLGRMDKQPQHDRCCAANKPPRWPDDSGYTWKWVKTRKARENARDAAEDSQWRNCVYFRLELFLLACLPHSASFFSFNTKSYNV